MGKLAALNVSYENGVDYDGLQDKREQARRRVREKIENRSLERKKKMSETLIEGSKDMSRKITDCLEFTEELNSLMEIISDRSKITTKNCEAVEAVVDDLEKSSKFTKDVANRTRDKIISLRSLVKETVRGLDSFVTNINEASKRNAESSRVIKELEKKSNDVGEMISAVSDIADQTNLLALNAAIEAARAGDHGKGFAVVADEVRNLAEVADKCALQIKEDIKIIQAEVGEISSEILRSEKQSKKQSEIGNTVNQELSNFEDESNKIVDLCNDIYEATTDLSHSSENFKRDLEEIVESAQQSTTASSQVFNSVQEQVKGLTDIQASSDDLSNMAYELSEVTDIGRHSGQLTIAAEELAATITESDIAAQEIMSSIMQISQGAKVQTNSAKEGSEKLTDFYGVSTSAGQIASFLSEKLNELRHLVIHSKQKVEEMKGGIFKSAEESYQSAEKVAKLEGRVVQIRKIVDSITAIALRTNMLAVQGAVEAARAGEEGKGFAVVAADIQNLADNSDHNAEQIKDLVHEIERQIQLSIQDIKETASINHHSSNESDTANEKLGKVEVEFGLVLEEINKVKANTKKSDEKIELVRQDIEAIVDGAESNLEFIDRAKETATKGNKKMRNLSESVSVIVNLADEVQK